MHISERKLANPRDQRGPYGHRARDRAVQTELKREDAPAHHEKLSDRNKPTAPLSLITWGGWGGKEESPWQLHYISHAVHPLDSFLLGSGDNNVPCDFFIHTAEVYFHEDE